MNADTIFSLDRVEASMLVHGVAGETRHGHLDGFTAVYNATVMIAVVSLNLSGRTI